MKQLEFQNRLSYEELVRGTRQAERTDFLPSNFLLIEATFRIRICFLYFAPKFDFFFTLTHSLQARFERRETHLSRHANI